MANAPASMRLQRASAGTLSAATVVERRAADVLVLGDSALASAACISLARKGKKVIHVPDMGLQAPRPAREALKPLIIPHPSAELTSMAADAASFWQGVQYQAQTPLLVMCGSLDLAKAAPASATSRDQQPVSAALLDMLGQFADNCRAAGVRTARVASADAPLLKLSEQYVGLSQVDSCVVNAITAEQALQSLAERAGVLLRDSVTLSGWQDTGSCFRVRVKSRLQPDAISVYEAEQVLLAPGTWTQDNLSLWKVDAGSVQYRARGSMRCTASPDLDKLPLIRHWSATPPSQQPTTPTNTSTRSTGASHSTASSKATPSAAPAGSKAATSASQTQKEKGRRVGVDMKDQIVISDHWVLFPRSQTAGAGKLTGVTGADRRLQSCWELTPAAAAASRSHSQQQQTALFGGWQQAQQLVRGLGPPVASPVAKGPYSEGTSETDKKSERGADVGAEKSEGSKGAVPIEAIEAAVGEGRRPDTQIAWDVVTPDGLPLLGWHPGFDAGRVLVACTAGGAAEAPHAPAHADGASAAPASPPGSSAGESTTVSPARSQQSAENRGEAGVPIVLNAEHDGWAMAPVLAKAAADMLLGVPASELPIDVARLALTRSGLAEGGDKDASEAVQLVDAWESLSDLQDGSVYARVCEARMTEDEKQEREEARVVAKLGKRVVR